MPMDPMSFWMQASIFWIKVFKQQQDAYLRVLGAVAEKIPHEDAARLAADADALKQTLKPKAAQRKPSVKAPATTLEPA